MKLIEIFKNMKHELDLYFLKRFQTIKEDLENERADWIDNLKRMNPQLTDLEIQLEECKLESMNIKEAKNMVKNEMVIMGYKGDIFSD